MSELLYKNKEWLTEKYINQNITVDEIAEVCHCSNTTIRTWLKNYDIPVKYQVPIVQNTMYKDREWLTHQVIDLNKTASMIAQELNVKVETVRKWIRKFNIRTNKLTSYQDKNWLIEYYLRRDMSVSELSQLCNVSEKELNELIAQYNLSKDNLPNYRRKAWLIENYSNSDIPLETLAKQEHVDSDIILKWLDKIGIPRREHEHAQMLPCAICGTLVLRKPCELKRSKTGKVFCCPEHFAQYESEYKEEFTEKHKYLVPIARKIEYATCRGCNSTFTISKSQRFNKPKNLFCSRQCFLAFGRTQRGELSPYYKGGHSNRNRSGAEWKDWYRAVYSRDGHVCQWCGADQKADDTVNLNVHHIKRFAEYPELRFDVNNGIVLCVSCHKKTLKHEEEYEEMFQRIVQHKNNELAVAPRITSATFLLGNN